MSTNLEFVFLIELSIVFHGALSFGTSTRQLVQRIKVYKKKSKVEIYTRRVRISFVGSEAKRNFLDCVYGFLFFVFFLVEKKLRLLFNLFLHEKLLNF